MKKAKLKKPLARTIHRKRKEIGVVYTPLPSDQLVESVIHQQEVAPQRNRTKQNLHVLDHGFVRLDDYMGDDLSVVNAARVSFNKRNEELQEGDEKLINYLLKNRHGTPFEHNAFKFHVRLPLFVAREWVRHRIGSFNEVSLRYTKIDPEFYIPEMSDVRVRVGKPGHYTYEQASPSVAENFTYHLHEQAEESKFQYESALTEGIAPELARLHLTVNVYTEWYWTVNARALMNFLSLRNAEAAQFEIRCYARAVEHAWSAIMPLTSKAFRDNERQAP